MNPIKIKVVKECVAFTNDNQDVKLGGIRIKLAPKVEKFISLEDLNSGRKSNLELVEYCNADLAQWYNNVPYGTEVVLNEARPKNLEGIYKNDNSL